MSKWLGLVFVLWSWLGGLYLIRTWPGEPTMSISQRAASAKKASKLLTMILVTGGVGFYIWLISWFVPRFKLSIVFTVILTLAFVLQIIAAFIPDSDAWRSKIHRLAAYSMAALYFPLGFLIISAGTISSTAKLVSLICLSYMIFASGLFFFVKRARNRYVFFQSLYIMAFQLLILSAAYL